MFKVGQKVAFITNAEYYCNRYSFMTPLNNKDIYIIRGLDSHGSDGIYLEGIYNLIIFGGETSYGMKHFKIIDETFATEVLEQIKEQIEQEELVLI